MNSKLLIATAAITGFTMVEAAAISVSPLTYNFNPEAQSGTYSYIDDSGRQLIDGQFGPNRILNSSDAYPYVGWLQPSVAISFTFDGVTAIDTVTVSALQAWLGNIALPNVYLLSSTDGQNWTQVASLITPETSVNNYQKRDLVFSDLNLNTEYLQVQLQRNAVGPWIFVDEVMFSTAEQSGTSATAVPETASTLSLMAIAVAGLLSARNWSASRKQS
jgi:hypothetical protein